MPRAVVLLILALAAAATAADLDGFARCLTRAGTTYYAASWCPHCAAQDRIFGRAVRYIRRVDCSGDGLACAAAGIRSYPTWELANGSRLWGVQSLGQLGRATGCELSEPRDRRASVDEDQAVPRSLSGLRTRERRVGGAVIIEIPGR